MSKQTKIMNESITMPTWLLVTTDKDEITQVEMYLDYACTQLLADDFLEQIPRSAMMAINAELDRIDHAARQRSFAMAQLAQVQA